MMDRASNPRQFQSLMRSRIRGVADAAFGQLGRPIWHQSGQGPYLRLMRADRPIGFWLLFWPCAWSLTLGSIAENEVWLNLMVSSQSGAVLIGAIVMRGAGCVWNDITDRHIDRQVARTKSRPIPQSQVSVKNAVIFMIALCLIGLLVLLQFDWFAVYLGFSSLLIVLRSIRL